MGETFAKISMGALALVAVYLLVVNASGTTSIVNSSSSGAASVLKTLQGR